jgi:hypothetical protein
MANLGSYFDEIDQTGYLDMISQPLFFGTAYVFVLNFFTPSWFYTFDFDYQKWTFSKPVLPEIPLYSTYQQICSNPIFFIL